MITYAFFNVKGGVGKTTSVTTLAHIFATKFNKKVLLLDLDPQANSSSFFLESPSAVELLAHTTDDYKDLEFLRTREKTITDLFLDDDLDINEYIVNTPYKNLDIIPSFLDLAMCDTNIRYSLGRPEERLKNHCKKIQDKYDICIIDCSPSVNIINTNGLVMTDYVFIPLMCDNWCVAGFCYAQQLINQVKKYYNNNLKIGGCFFCQWASLQNISHSIREVFKTYKPNEFIDIQIRQTVKIKESSHNRKPISSIAPNSNTSQDYIKLAEYMLNNCSKEM